MIMNGNRGDLKFQLTLWRQTRVANFPYAVSIYLLGLPIVQKYFIKMLFFLDIPELISISARRPKSASVNQVIIMYLNLFVL